MVKWHIAGKSPHQAIRLAAKELTQWLSLAMPGAKFSRSTRLDRADFVLGTFDDLGPALGGGLRNDRWDDRVVVRTVGHKLFLAGSNPRSVLFAVYTYLDALGFAWIVPGPDGQVVPKLKHMPLGPYDIDHQASMMYRGFGLAGAFDQKMGQEFVQWMARNRFNHLFLEGSTRKSSYQQALGKTISLERARRIDAAIVKTARQRGLNFESMGHGWTAWTLGFAPDVPVAKDVKLTGKALAMSSQLKGDRGIHGSPGNTHLCLSHPQAGPKMARLIADYARLHPEIDVLSVWMADGANNWCECDKCAKVHPSDLWVAQVNRISREVYKVRKDLKIEVLGYSVLMEPPPTQRIDTTRGNIVLMYAPFLRCYLHSLDDQQCVSDIPVRTFPPANRLPHPMNAEYFNFFAGWRRKFAGTNYVFDYYAWLPIKRDIFEGDVAAAMAKDTASYPAHGIGGIVDCSRAQSFWPTPMIRWMQSRGCWDSSIDCMAERRRLLELTFGPAAGVADRYLKLTYDCLLPDRHGREEERTFDAAKVKRYKRQLPGIRRAIGRAIAAAGSASRAGCSVSRAARKKFVRRLAVHADFTLLHLGCLLAEQAGQFDLAMDLATRMHALARKNDNLLAGVADPPEFDWLKRDTLKRLEAKKAGTWKRID